MATQNGTSGDDSLTGTAGEDTIHGNAGQDTLAGDGGNDTLYGGDGYDSIYGGEGNDDLYGGSDGSYDDMYGGGGDDRIYASDANDNWAYGGTGNDTIFGGSGDDVIGGDDDDDTLHGNDGDDTLYGGYGSDTISGGDGDDQILGEWGDDSLSGDAGNDTFYLSNSAGNDSIDGGTGQDKVHFVSGDDVTITVGPDDVGNYSQLGGDTSGSFRNIEEIQTNSGDDQIDASQAASSLTITAAAGDDVVMTGQGSDTIYGGAGRDTLDGGAGNAMLVGGSGDDVFAFGQGSGADTILDFDTGDSDGNGQYNDQLDVSGLKNPDGRSITVDDVTVVDDGNGNARLLFPQGESVVLQGVSPAQMSSNSQLNAAGIPCFTPGVQIATEHGNRLIEDLAVGDRVFTRDHGLQPIRWIGQRVVTAEGRFAPVLIQPSVFGHEAAPILVSQKHRVLFSGYRAELLFGTSEVFMPAKHLIDGVTAVLQPGGDVTYIHLMFDSHEVIYANGVPTESFHPGDQALAGTDPAAREELFALFPELRTGSGDLSRTARRCLKEFESQMLMM